MERTTDPQEKGRRPYIGVFFRCCQVYQRIYRAPGKDRYSGFCPRCLRKLEVPVSPQGTEARLFEAE